MRSCLHVITLTLPLKQNADRSSDTGVSIAVQVGLWHVGGGAVIDGEQFLLRHVTDEVVSNIDMLHSILKNGYGGLIIAVEGNGVGKRMCYFR